MLLIAGCLAITGLAGAVLLPGPLSRIRTEHSPRIGIAMWLVAVGGVLIVWLAAALTALMALAYPRLAAGAAVSHDGLSLLLHSALGVLATVGITWLVIAAAWQFCRDRAARKTHCQALRLVSSAAPRLGSNVVVVESPQRSAYSVAGRGGTIVVTSGMLKGLSHNEVQAVLTHEAAHLSGHHQTLLSVLSSLARAGAWLPLFPAALNAVSQLLEMRADDIAARSHGPGLLMTALVSMTAGPAFTMSAGGNGVLARAERLVAPVSGRRRAFHAAAGLTGAAAAAAAPVVLGAALLTACGF
ncbi:M56 family metallopeptidase [Hoyosella sp. YIM 151337]|uniref:M56 family metallopeptidase n=1 Tax=Hoyosella sp. YIM 151337 TaxID=2992742 RepID=UPI002235D4A7|nr:M56 family metallopeptidase [Hoyosella sp. YIM 151337]MCW4351964.1 M56 family metallopeptidase [Hoyosella sp. YIM 151337]